MPRFGQKLFVLPKQIEIRRHVSFLNRNPHMIVVGQNACNQVCIGKNHVPFLRRGVSYVCEI